MALLKGSLNKPGSIGLLPTFSPALSRDAIRKKYLEQALVWDDPARLPTGFRGCVGQCVYDLKTRNRNPNQDLQINSVLRCDRPAMALGDVRHDTRRDRWMSAADNWCK